jgi:hypothetical protein
MTVLAVLQVLQMHPTSARESAVTLFGTTLAVALVEAYSESIAAMIGRGRSITHGEIGEILHEVAPVMVGAQAPAVVVLASAVGIMTLPTALRLAETVAFLLLFLYGVRVGQLLHASKARWIASGLVLVVIGGIIVGFKAAFH